MKFQAMKVSTRLAIAFGVVLATIAATSVFTLMETASIQANMNRMVNENGVKTKLLNDMVDSINVVTRVTRSMVLLSDRADREAEVVKIEKARATYDKSWAALEKMPTGEAGQALRNRIQAAQVAVRPINNKVMELAMAGKAAEATTMLMQQSNPGIAQWQDALEENIALQEKTNIQEFAESQAEYAMTRNLLIGSGVLCALLSVLAAWWVTRSITRQLGAEPSDAVALAQDVAAGKLTTQIPLREGDNSSMMAALKAMQESLVKVVNGVRVGSESLSLASAEIAQGNQDLSSRTESQASALQQTAASMEQLSSTVRQNADNSKQANQLARSASDVAVQGGEVVSKVVSTMQEISDSSRKIADIISVIDGIAFQTNILALNAAVEAARAGEQGRGFAVVATEVRSLAGRSADAAKEIKTLINNSVERVEAGTLLVDQAGATMQEVVGAVKRVTDLMGEISAASVEQSTGVSQVGEAVTQMDQVTQQNAALVEEMAAAASSLRSQADELVSSVAVFSTGSHNALTSVRPTQVRAAANPDFKGPERRNIHVAALTRQAMAKAASSSLSSTSKPDAGNMTKVNSSPKTPAVVAQVTSNEDWETF